MNICNSKISEWFIWITLPLLLLRYAVHLICFYKSPQRPIIKQELHHISQTYKLRFPQLIQLIWALHRNPYFLSLFYYRLGPSRAFICSLFRKDISSLEIYCDNMGTTLMYHPFSTIINAKAIGNNFKLRNNTTIGNINDDHNRRQQ